MTLLQYTDQVKYFGLTFTDFPADYEFGDIIFLGMTRSTQVFLLFDIYIYALLFVRISITAISSY